MKKRKAQPQAAAQAEVPTILDIAKGLVYGDRNKAYGHPSVNLQNVVNLWNAYILAKIVHQNGQPTLSTTDAAMLNILQKVARVATNPTHIDSIVDIAGYAAVVERIITKR
jgi:hypothetical protein